MTHNPSEPPDEAAIAWLLRLALRESAKSKTGAQADPPGRHWGLFEGAPPSARPLAGLDPALARWFAAYDIMPVPRDKDAATWMIKSDAGQAFGEFLLDEEIARSSGQSRPGSLQQRFSNVSWPAPPAIMNLGPADPEEDRRLRRRCAKGTGCTPTR